MKQSGFFTVINGRIYKNGKLVPYYHKPLTDEENKLLDEILDEYYNSLKS